MSKAFTREDDSAPELRPSPRRVATLPIGAKNYLTPGGAMGIEGELKRLESELLPLRSQPSIPEEMRAEVSRLEERMARLRQALRTGVIVAPPEGSEREIVRFGASVEVREPCGELVTYRIVGTEEVDLSRGWISWVSPLAKALLETRAGAKVCFQSPGGRVDLEVLTVTYD